MGEIPENETFILVLHLLVYTLLGCVRPDIQIQSVQKLTDQTDLF